MKTQYELCFFFRAVRYISLKIVSSGKPVCFPFASNHANTVRRTRGIRPQGFVDVMVTYSKELNDKVNMFLDKNTTASTNLPRKIFRAVVWRALQSFSSGEEALLGPKQQEEEPGRYWKHLTNRRKSEQEQIWNQFETLIEVWNNNQTS